MPDISEGLTEGAAPDVNSEAGFEAALTSKGFAPDPGAEPALDTAVASGLTVAEPDAPARDEKGQFAPTPAEEPEDTSVVEETEDPALAAYLAKYDGDVDKALKAAAEAQSVIGRQGQELGATREELAELRGRLDAMAQMQTAAPSVPQEQVEERAIDMSSRLGYFAAATELANESLRGDTRAYDAVLSNWVLEDPIAAQRFDLDFQLWKRDEAAKAAPATEDPARAYAEEQRGVANITQTLGEVSKERGEGWATIAPHMETALEQVPEAITLMLGSDDASERLGAARIVADRAYIIAASAPAGTPDAAQAAADAATARKLAGSQVATGSLRPAPADEGGTPTREEQLADFKRRIVEADSTRVIDGLTYGK